MGDMFRSEEMVLSQLFIQPEAAYYIISELGEAGIVQFRDLNEDVNVFQRSFASEVKRCDELERKLKYIEAEIIKDGVKIPEVLEIPKAPNPREIIDLEAHLDKTEGDIKELSESAVSLKSNYLELTELKYVLEKTHVFFSQDEANGIEVAQKALIPEDAQASRAHLGFVAGVIKREKMPGFERMLWRVSRGNVFLRRVEIDEPMKDPATGHEMLKTVFVAFYQGEELKSRILKVCHGFHAALYNCPNSLQERSEMLKGVNTSLEDLNMVLNQTQDHRFRVLGTVAKELRNWSVMVSKMKAIYHTLNFFSRDVSKKCLIGECWVPSRDVQVVQKALTDGSKACGSSISSFLNLIETKETPPTYYRTNKFTRGFQNLIDAYGVASYREVNPALYTIISFPFLFAVMFGDIGHSVIMILAGAYLVLAENKLQAKKIKNEIFNIFFVGRYVILLMGIFSLYTGIIYNDVFSKSLNIFGSSWKVNANVTFATTEEFLELNPRGDYEGTPYFIGIDPIWQVAKNKIIFLNSFKMKLSIVIGVAHMIFGVCVSVINFVHFGNRASIYLEFLPQILLLCFLFLWMVIMMFMKWIMFSCDPDQPINRGSSCAPSVLIFFIDMMLFNESKPPHKKCDAYMFQGQDILQKILIFGSLICIPVLLLGKPIHIMMSRKKKQATISLVQDNSDVDTPQGSDSTHSEEEEPMSEIFIHQAIHTIEYVLSTISHTASYLRLWALSLAHAQLSDVLWFMIFQKAFIFPGFIGAATIYIIFAPWAVFTVSILVLMEGLSAFLHTLRLHWVEFMSKFYTGVGYLFEPFSFKRLLEDGEEEG